ncbi:unnamed protein product [Citrullus colocynthis]|uniref:Cytochrome b-c1 complex subunit 9 n=1 Tax=Citrullus colocynthis TaxID=252529 RepID=A0ABP0YKT3_9ROSI
MTLPLKPNSPLFLPHPLQESDQSRPKDDQTQLDTSSPLASEENGRERLKRHRVAVAGQVWIPEKWGKEEFLKDWIDGSAFEASLFPSGVVSARRALARDAKRLSPNNNTATATAASAGALRIFNTRRSGGGLLEGLYRVIMRRNSVYVTFIIAGAFVGERAVDYGVHKLWERNNVGKRYEDISVLGQRQSEE